jgi:hypothetical protein
LDPKFVSVVVVPARAVAAAATVASKQVISNSMRHRQVVLIIIRREPIGESLSRKLHGQTGITPVRANRPFEIEQARGPTVAS